MTQELAYVALLFALFVVPKVLLRFRVPTAVTELGLGTVAGLGFGLFVGDDTVQLLSSLGIVTLFLLAGLEVDSVALARGKRIIAEHLAVRSVLLAAATWGASVLLDLPWRPACLVALALLTPSVGYILSSIRSLHFTERETFWVKTKAIATEILALMVLFAVIQSSTLPKFLISLGGLLALVFGVPLLLKAFASAVAPYAPRSEFAFLVMLAVLCGTATRALGVYYLVGAFIVGWAAQRFREKLPAVASENMVHAVEVFASFFIPFYFFGAGLHLTAKEFSSEGIAFGGLFLAAMLPVRIAAVAIHRRISLGESIRGSSRIAISLTPTLVFTLVLAEILRDRYGVSAPIFGGLVIYALATTLIPVLAIGQKPPASDVPEIPVLEDAG